MSEKCCIFANEMKSLYDKRHVAKYISISIQSGVGIYDINRAAVAIFYII